MPFNDEGAFDFGSSLFGSSLLPCSPPNLCNVDSAKAAVDVGENMSGLLKLAWMDRL